MAQYSFTSTETRRLVRTNSPGQPPGLSHSSWTMTRLWKYESIYICMLHSFCGMATLVISLVLHAASLSWVVWCSCLPSQYKPEKWWLLQGYYSQLPAYSCAVHLLVVWSEVYFCASLTVGNCACKVLAMCWCFMKRATEKMMVSSVSDQPSCQQWASEPAFGYRISWWTCGTCSELGVTFAFVGSRAQQALRPLFSLFLMGMKQRLVCVCVCVHSNAHIHTKTVVLGN